MKTQRKIAFAEILGNAVALHREWDLSTMCVHIKMRPVKHLQAAFAYIMAMIICVTR